MTTITPDMLAAHGLSSYEFDLARRGLGRLPNPLELAMIGAMWSERCCYKSSRAHLGRLPRMGAHVVMGAGPNVGAVDIGEDLAAVVAMDSDNAPSITDAPERAAAAASGALQTVFARGARPIALLNAVEFGALDAAETKPLARGALQAIAQYANAVGAPTVSGLAAFDGAHARNMLVNAMAVGVAQKARLSRASAGAAGLALFCLSARTQRGGTEPDERFADPKGQKRVMEASLELIQSGAALAVQAVGAAGLLAACSKMAADDGIGVRLDLSKVPLNEAAMSPAEILLSEHQVKVVVALAPDQIDAALAICEKREIDGAAIGETTTNGRLQIAGAAGAEADLPVALLTTGAPSFERSAEAPSAPSPAQPVQVGDAPLLPALERLMASPELCSRRWIWEQYGGEIGGRTLLGPGEDAVLIGVDGSPRALACALAGLGRYSAADPFEGTKQAVAEAVRKIVAVGAKPLGLTTCLNFGDPEHADVMGAFMSAIDGLAEAADALRLPVVSSDVSFHQETEGGDAPRTPIVGAVGLLTDRARRRSMGSAKPGEALYLLGATEGWLAQSVYALRELGRRGGPPPPVNFTAERRAAAFLHHLLARDFPCALHVVSEGGALTAAAEMALAANVGLHLETPADSAAEGAAFWFGEDHGRILLASEPEFAVQLFAEAKEHGVAIAEIGVFEGDALRLGEESAPLTALRSAHEGALPRYLA